MYRHIALCAALILFVAGVMTPATAAEDTIAPTAEETKPLGVGETLPDVNVVTADGEESTLIEALGGKPTALIFYRGGWCPYCTRHLAGLKEAEAELKALGYQIVGITPEPPEKIAETVKDKELDYDIISDSELAAAKAMGLAFDLGAVKGLAYQAYGATLVDRALPVPAVYLVDEAAEILFVHAEPDYKKRLSNEKLLEAAKAGSAE